MRGRGGRVLQGEAGAAASAISRSCRRGALGRGARFAAAFGWRELRWWADPGLDQREGQLDVDDEGAEREQRDGERSRDGREDGQRNGDDEQHERGQGIQRVPDLKLDAEGSQQEGHGVEGE
jgi:hypothetical protein